MPEIKDIDKLKNRLNTFGDEYNFLQQKGDSFEDITPKDEDDTPIDMDDMSALLAGIGNDIDDDIAPDHANSDINLDEDLSQDSSAIEEEIASDNDDFSMPDNFDQGLEDIFGNDSLNTDENPDTLLDKFETSDEGESGFELGSMDNLFSDSDEDFNLPELEEDAFSADSDEDFNLPELEEDAFSADSDEDFNLPELEEDASSADDDDLPELDVATASGDDDDLPELGVASSSDDDFDIGKLDSISLDDEFEDSRNNDSESMGELENFEIEAEFDSKDNPKSSSDEFSLEDLGHEYGDINDLAEPVVASKESANVSLDNSNIGTGVYISAEKLAKVLKTLESFPVNLKLHVETLISNPSFTGQNVDALIKKLAAGASPKEIADLVFKLTGKRIRLPAQFGKTWEELEREKASFSYILKNRILPFVGKALIILFLLLCFFFVGNNFIWKPLYSSYLYKKGYEALVNEQYPVSERFFLQAVKVKPVKKQFLKYADGYIEKREYDDAEKKYAQMLGVSLSQEREKPRKERERGYFLEDKDGFIAYSALKTFYQGDFSNAERIIEDFLLFDKNKWDYEMLLRKIDNYLNWAELDKTKFDNAEYIINDSLIKFGTKTPLFFRKIALSVRGGRLDIMREKALSSGINYSDDENNGNTLTPEKRRYFGILNQYRGFIEGVKEKQLDPFIAVEFYKYLIDNGNVDEIEPELVRISNIDKTLPEPHYQLSKIWNIVEKNALEKESLDNTEKLLEIDTMDRIREFYPHSYTYARRERKRIEVDTLNRLGSFDYNDGNVLDAQKYYKRAITEYENNVDLLGAKPEYGRLYEDLGDIYYYTAGKYGDAFKEYEKAEALEYKNDNLSYKIGFIYYRNKSYGEASERFYDITNSERDNESALYAFANSSFYNGVYSPSRAYYEQVAEKLEYWQGIQSFIELDRRPDQRIVYEKLMQVYNNLGVTLYKLSEQSKNIDYYSTALVYFEKSAEMYDLMSRNPEYLTRSFTIPLAQLNMRYALVNAGRRTNYIPTVIPYSRDNVEFDSPVIYSEIDQDLFGRVAMVIDLE